MSPTQAKLGVYPPHVFHRRKTFLVDRDVRLNEHVQSEEGDSSAADTAVGSKTSSAFETCLKIRGLGVDTVGTLDALCSVLSAANGSAGGVAPSEGAEENTEAEAGTDVIDSVSEAVELSNGLAEAVEQSERGGGTTTSTASAPGGTRGDTDHSESEIGGKISVQQSLPTATSSAPPALWSLEFAYSELERVVEALETVVSGLIFVVGAAANIGAQPESSALW